VDGFRSGALALAGALTIACTTPAQAEGIARIAQTDGTVREYPVSLRVIDHRAVRIVSADGRDTLAVGKAACSYVGELERCLPYRIVLDRAGRGMPSTSGMAPSI